MKPEKQPDIISQSLAAQKAGVSRQAISSLKSTNSSYNFFTPDGKVNTAHPDWQSYIEERKNKTGQGMKLAENNLQKPGKKKSEHTGGKKSHGEKEKSAGKGEREYNADHALTGGYDPSMFYPQNPSQLKSLTDIVAKNLEMRIKLGELISRDILDSYIDKIAQGVNQFVALSRGVSTDICEKLDRIGMEREVEKIINPKVKVMIEYIIESCNNAKR